MTLFCGPWAGEGKALGRGPGDRAQPFTRGGLAAALCMYDWIIVCLGLAAVLLFGEARAGQSTTAARVSLSLRLGRA